MLEPQHLVGISKILYSILYYCKNYCKNYRKAFLLVMPRFLVLNTSLQIEQIAFSCLFKKINFSFLRETALRIPADSTETAFSSCSS